MSAATPIRYPDARSQQVMTARAWWLVALGIVIPGSAQVLAGNRRLGRFALGTTLLLWALAVAAVVVLLVQRQWLIAFVTTPAALWAVAVLAAFYGVLWVVLAIDTLRLVRLVKVRPASRVLVAGLVVVSLAAIVGATVTVERYTVSAIGVLDEVFSDGSIAEPIDGRYNILLLGGDAGPDRVGLRPDSISVISVDAHTGRATILGIPRNLEYAPFSEGSPLYGPYPNGYDCGVECLISYLYTYGSQHAELYPDAEAEGSTPGVEATRDAVEGVLGIPLQYYVLIDMKGFADLIDALGGVDIDVEQRLPIGGGTTLDGRPNKITGWIEPGEQHMDGYTALWYARSRATTDDYDRMARQRVLQEAILKQMNPANVLAKFTDVADAGKQVVSTDIPQPMLAHFVELALKAKEQPVTSYDFVPPDWNSASPDFDAIQAKVEELLAPVTSSPTPGG